ILVALGTCPEKWGKFLLKNYGLPEVPQPRYEIQSVNGESRDRKSATLTDELLSLHMEASANDGVALSPAWLLYLEYMDVIAEALSPKESGAALKQCALDDARSRYWEQPPDVFRPMNASLGTPAQFRERWFYGELEIRVRPTLNRRDFTVEVWCLPPDEPENLDDAGEPDGHWDGLKWTPTPTEN
ncbi:MAG: hypothetical protein WCD47_12465, partial [Candidatus Sulfotelmatobacter sp.]